MSIKCAGCILALTALTVSSAAYAQTQSALTNETVEKLVASGIASDVIVGLIHAQPGSYSTSPDQLAALRQAGASTSVLAAIVSHQEPASAPIPPTHDSASVLRDGTPVRLRLARTLSSAQAVTGDKIDFDVLDDIRVGDTVVIARGTKAIGSITEAEQRKRMGRGGKLNLVLEYVRLADGTKAAIRAERAASGNGHVGAMTAGIVATSLVVWPAAPFFLMMHGKEAVIPEGTEITAYVNGDVSVPASAGQGQ